MKWFLAFEVTKIPGTDQSKGDFLRELKKAGKKVNKTTLAELEDEPKLPDDLLAYWYAFFNLNKERGTNGFSVCPLKLQDIILELKIQNLPVNAYAVSLIRALDDDYVIWVHENYFNKDKKNTPK